jgi:pantothenate kinase
MQDKELEDYEPADIAMALTRMVSYNIGHLAYLNAKRYNLSRVFFGGFYIRGHPYTMETISFAIRFWSKVSSITGRRHHQKPGLTDSLSRPVPDQASHGVDLL